jgi:DNA replication and repair protein RecF
MRADGAPVERLLDLTDRPLVSVFLPDRLELIKGAPALRRAHLDQFLAALWPSRVSTRRAYAQALAQRNALISRIRSGAGSRLSLPSWDRQLAAHGIALMSDRREAVDRLTEPFARLSETLGLTSETNLSYRPRSKASSAEELATELGERLDGDLERGFTGHGPHRDDLVARRAGHDLRAYGSQGQQRLALLALLLAEREVIAQARRSPPLMLLDDVMSELDRTRRNALVEALRASGGQSIITTTDLEHVPGAVSDPEIRRIEVADGRLLQDGGGGLTPEAVAA